MPTTEVISIKQTCKNGNVDGLELKVSGYLLVGQSDESEFTPMIYNPKISSGDILYAMVFRPHNFKLGRFFG
jgi:dipeptidyl-peptidase 9